MKNKSTSSNISSPWAVRSLPTRIKRQALPVILAGFAILAGNAQAVLITGFESPPFTTGQPYGTVQAPYGTWVGTESSNLSVVSGISYEGTQSLRATAFGTTATTNSPDLFDWGFTGTSFYFMNPTATFNAANQSIARWELSWTDSAGGDQYRISMNLRFASETTFDLRFDGTPNTAGTVFATGTGTTRAINTGNVDYTDWTRIDMNFDYDTGSFVVLMTNPDDTTFSTSVALSANFTDDSRVSIARFGVSNTAPSGAGGIVYFDNFSAVPEPSTAVLAACGLGLLAFRRKKRIG